MKSSVDFGEHFLRTQNPIIVMRMPGCYEVAANQELANRFGSDFRIVRSPADYAALIKTSAKTEEETTGIPCACTRIHGAIALESRHCAFEDAAEKLKKSEGSLDRWEATLGFFDLRQNGARDYSVFKVHSRFLTSNQDKLEARLLELDHVRVNVRLEGDERFPKKGKLRVAAMRDDRLVLPEESIPISENSIYHEAGEAFSIAIQELTLNSTRLERVRDETLERIRKLAKEYDPIVSYVSQLFEESETTLPSLIKIRERLFDAPALYDYGSRIWDNLADPKKQATLVAPGSLREAAAQENSLSFMRQLPKLLERYPGEFVLLHRGIVVEHNADERKLHQTALKYPMIHELLVQHVRNSPSQRPAVLLKPRLQC